MFLSKQLTIFKQFCIGYNNYLRSTLFVLGKNAAKRHPTVMKNKLKYIFIYPFYRYNDYRNLRYITAPTITNGGMQPMDIRMGNRILPIIEPIRPNIIAKDTIIVLQEIL